MHHDGVASVWNMTAGLELLTASCPHQAHVCLVGAATPWLLPQELLHSTDAVQRCSATDLKH